METRFFCTFDFQDDKEDFFVKYRFLLLLTALIWGFAFTAQSVAMDDIGPLTFSAVRCFVGAAALLPVLFFLKEDAPPKAASFPEWMAVAVAGFLFCCGTVLQQIGILYTTVAKASFITATYILLVPIFGLFVGHVLRVNHAMGAVLAMTGVYFLSVTETFSINPGDILIALCAVGFSCHILYMDYAAARYSPIHLACGQFFVCGVISLVGAFLWETPSWEAIFAAAVPILYVGIFSTGVAYTLQIVGQRHLPPTECSMILSLEMVFGGLGGFLFLGETLTSREWIGVLLMTVGVFLSQIPSRPVGGRRVAKALRD